MLYRILLLIVPQVETHSFIFLYFLSYPIQFRRHVILSCILVHLITMCILSQLEYKFMCEYILTFTTFETYPYHRWQIVASP